MAELITGDSRPYVANLTINGVPFEIPLLTKVQASLVSTDKSKVFIKPIILLSTTFGADWEESKVVFKFSRAETKAVGEFITDGKPLKALVEIQVELPDGTGTSDWTWWLPISVVKGSIV